jgi:plastocyanin
MPHHAAADIAHGPPLIGDDGEDQVRSAEAPGRRGPGGRPLRLVVAGLALAGLALAGCGDDGEAAVELVEGVEVAVSAIDNTFRPETVEVAAGTEVVWTNDGRNDHNVLPVDGGDWGVEAEGFAPDDVYRHRFTEPGTYRYYCSLHGTTTKGMVGTVVVTG